MRKIGIHFIIYPLLVLVRTTYMCVLRARPIRGESHIQRNANREVAIGPNFKEQLPLIYPKYLAYNFSLEISKVTHFCSLIKIQFRYGIYTRTTTVSAVKDLFDPLKTAVLLQCFIYTFFSILREYFPFPQCQVSFSSVQKQSFNVTATATTRRTAVPENFRREMRSFCSLKNTDSFHFSIIFAI